MLDHTTAAPALKALNAMRPIEARRTALAFLASQDPDLRDLLDAMGDYLDARAVILNRWDHHDEYEWLAAERMCDAAAELFRSVETA